MVKKKTNVNVEALFKPFSAEGWIVVASFTIILALFLNKAKVVENYWFWIVGTLVEQCDILKSYLKRKTLLLLWSWVWTAFLLRNVYTSSMYTYLTMEPNIVDLPESFQTFLETGKGNMLTGVDTFKKIASNFLLPYSDTGKSSEAMISYFNNRLWQLNQEYTPFEKY